ncbi:MAG: right-handed parallel beta-helix repeat-containing protein [Planctomycetota bacterium]
MLALALARRLALLLTPFVAAASAQAQILHVDLTLTTGAGDGSSWQDAFQGPAGLEDAFAAATPGTTIWATGGTYRVTSSYATVWLQLDATDVTFIGGFVGGEGSPFERPGPDRFPTVLSGDALGDDDGSPVSTFDNAYRVLHVSNAHGFTMEHVHVMSARTFGFEAVRSDVRIRRCVFQGNHGSGARVLGGFGLSSFVDAGRIVDCVFRGNGEDGLQLDGHFDVTASAIDRCRFEGNTRHGLDLTPMTGLMRAEISSSLFARNGQAGIHAPVVTEVGTQVRIRRSTIVANGVHGFRSFGACGLSPCPALTDNVLWGNGGSQIARNGGFAELSGNVVEGSSAVGSLTADNLFVDFAAGDYRLRSGSIAVDAGTVPIVPPAVGPPLDVLGARRIYNDPSVPDPGTPAAQADVGAFEHSPFIGAFGDCPTTPNSTGVPGRIFAEGSLAAVDLDLRLSARGVPQNQFGVFLVSRSAGLAPMAGGGSGTLCLGGDIGRFNGPGQILSSGANGTFALDVDLSTVPQPSAFVTVRPGETWRFQAWHRDLAPGAFSNQFTDAVALRFR